MMASVTVPIMKCATLIQRPQSMLWGHWYPLFLTSDDSSHGFQSLGGSIIGCTKILKIASCNRSINACYLSQELFSKSESSILIIKLLCKSGRPNWLKLPPISDGGWPFLTLQQNLFFTGTLLAGLF